MTGTAKLLVTGGTGLLGRHIQEELNRRGLPFFAFGRKQFDLTDRKQAEAVFAAHRDATLVLHLASHQAAGEYPSRHTGEQFHLNNLIHIHALEAWRQFIPHARFIGMGASCAYPSTATSLTEDRILDGPIHGSVYTYGFTKRLLYTGILAYNDQFKLNGSFVIPASLYGEYDDYNESTAHVAGALIGRFVRAVKTGSPEVEIWGDGSQVRDFMDAQDLARALLDLAPLLDRETLNVCPGAGKTIKELASAISQAAGYQGRIVFNADRYVGAKEKFLDGAKLRAKYKMTLGNDLGPGIQRTVRWFAEHFETLKDRRKFA